MDPLYMFVDVLHVYFSVRESTLLVPAATTNSKDGMLVKFSILSIHIWNWPLYQRLLAKHEQKEALVMSSLEFAVLTKKKKKNLTN